MASHPNKSKLGDAHCQELMGVVPVLYLIAILLEEACVIVIPSWMSVQYSQDDMVHLLCEW